MDMTGMKVAVAVLGFALSTSGISSLRGVKLPLLVALYAKQQFMDHISRLERDDILRHLDLDPRGGDMEPYKVGYIYMPGVSKSDDFPSLAGNLPLKADVRISDKVKNAVVEKGNTGEEIRGNLEFLTMPRFACVFFPLEMFRRAFSEFKNIKGEYLRYWTLCGELNCKIEQKKLKKNGRYFSDFEGYTFYTVEYKETLSGCIFKMLYFFDKEGRLAGFSPQFQGVKLLREEIACNSNKGSPCFKLSFFPFPVEGFIGGEEFE